MPLHATGRETLDRTGGWSIEAIMLDGLRQT
jgi:hypothetical protein